MNALLYFALYVLILGLVAWAIIYVIDMVGVPDPMNRIAKLIVAIVVLFVIIFYFLKLVPGLPG